MMTEMQHLVVDCGSGSCAVGLAGEEAPVSYQSAVVGRSRHPRVLHSMATEGTTKLYVGDEAQNQRGMLTLSQPVCRGAVRDWPDMTALCGGALRFCCRHYRLGTDADEGQLSDCGVLFSAPVLGSKRNRELLAEMAMEQLGMAAFCVEYDAVLALMASGRGVGLITQLGDGVCSCVPIWFGHVQQRAVVRRNMGGSDLTAYLARLLGRGHCSSAEMDMVRDIKEKCCAVSPDILPVSSDFSNYAIDNDITYEMPDGYKIRLGEERFRCPEAIFQPGLMGHDTEGLQDLIFESIMKSEMDFRKDLYTNIILGGGSTMFKGFTERLEKELRLLVPPTMVLKAVAQPDRKYSVWVGGSMLASLSTYQPISRKEYEEYGQMIVHKKCPQVM